MSAYLETEHRKPAASNADRELAYARRLIVHARDSLDAPRLGIAEVTRAMS
jgi:hypothetical protein